MTERLHIRIEYAGGQAQAMMFHFSCLRTEAEDWLKTVLGKYQAGEEICDDPEAWYEPEIGGAGNSMHYKPSRILNRD